MNRSLLWSTVFGTCVGIATILAGCRNCDSTSAGADGCPPTPLARDQILPPNEGRLRNQHQHLETDLKATLLVNAGLLRREPLLAAGDPAAREERRRLEGAVAIVTDLDDIVADRRAAAALGKALFWDVSVGSDGQTACATCHYEAGADARDPARRQRASLGVAPRVFAGIKPGQPVEKALPWSPEAAFDALVRQFPPLADRREEFEAAEAAYAEAIRKREEREAKAAAGTVRAPVAGRATAAMMRQLTSHNTPTVIGAVFFDRLFHDGRARAVFNGYDDQGDDAAPDPVGKWRCRDGRLERVLVRLPHAALASQATTPAMSSVEMSWYGRRFHDLARKLLPMAPLSHQDLRTPCAKPGEHLPPSDSLLGDYRAIRSYEEWFRLAFRSEWLADGRIVVPVQREADGKRLELRAIEANFALLWGVAIMLYEELLVSDATPYDRGKLTPQQQRGLEAFRRLGCVDCHLEPEFTAAARSHLFGPLTELEGPEDTFGYIEGNDFVTWVRQGRPGTDARAELMPIPLEMAPEGKSQLIVAYDAGFYAAGFLDPQRTPGIGRRLVGEADALAHEAYPNDTLRAIGSQFGGQGDPTEILRALARPAVARSVVPFRPLSLARRRWPHVDTWIDGTVKTPSLRNVVRTGPWFTEGEDPNLGAIDSVAKAVAAYREPPYLEANRRRHLHPAVSELADRSAELDEATVADITAFLEQGLLDPRVKERSAPFDHPPIWVPIEAAVDEDGRTASPTAFKAVLPGGPAGK